MLVVLYPSVITLYSQTVNFFLNIDLTCMLVLAIPIYLQNVYIFDLEDVLVPDLIVFGAARSLAFSKHQSEAFQRWSIDMINYIGETFFFKNDLEVCFI